MFLRQPCPIIGRRQVALHVGIGAQLLSTRRNVEDLSVDGAVVDVTYFRLPFPSQSHRSADFRPINVVLAATFRGRRGTGFLQQLQWRLLTGVTVIAQ